MARTLELPGWHDIQLSVLSTTLSAVATKMTPIVTHLLILLLLWRVAAHKIKKSDVTHY